MKTYYSAGTGYNKHLVLSVFLILLLGVCLIASFWSIIHFSSMGNIAYADSTNGIVNNNILLDSDLLNLSGSTTGSRVDLGSWFMQVGSCSLSDNVFTSNSQYGQLSQSIPNVSNYIGHSLTLTFSLSNVTGRLGIVIYSNTNIAVNNNITTGGVYSITGIIPNNTSAFRIVLQNINTGSSSCTIDFAKLEFGSSFTGYVPKNYQNYGYSQGYTEGSTNNPVLNSSYINASDWSTYISDVFSGYNWGLTTNNYNYTKYFEYNGKNYGYYNFSAGGTGNGDFNITFSLINNSATDYYATCFLGTVAGGEYSFVFYPSDNYDVVVVSSDINSIVKYSPYANVVLNDKAVFVLNIPVTSNVYLCAKNTNSNLVVHSNSYELGLTYTNLFIKTGEQYQYNNGYSAGFTAGMAQGKSVGYTEGYNYATSLDPQTHTFLGLFGAVVQAPVNVVRDMLDFELLGINLTAFFYSMISIALVLFILRLFL